MPLAREVDLFPPGDFAFVAVVHNPALCCDLWLYTWEQVEGGKEDGRTHPPRNVASLANREAIQLAKYLLVTAGHPAAKQINVPDQKWNQAGKRDDNEKS